MVEVHDSSTPIKRIEPGKSVDLPIARLEGGMADWFNFEVWWTDSRPEQSHVTELKTP